jgi:hypothetical protein
MRSQRSVLFGCLAAGLCLLHQGRAHAQVIYVPDLPPQGIVYVANGSGGSRSATDNLVKTFRKAHIPFYVETIWWTQGDITRDICDRANHRGYGELLARKARAYRCVHPDHRIIFLSHSAGVAVVTAALEQSPPGIVDRAIVLGAGCSTIYDLRSSLYRVREGIDSFYSTHDGVLDAAEGSLGTSDGPRVPTAGRIGFSPIITCANDQALYQKLRQYRWNSCMEKDCNFGGHYGWLWPNFMVHYIVPKVTGADLAGPYGPGVLYGPGVP